MLRRRSSGAAGLQMKTRKRGRSPEQDCSECMPISKRITRLNIQSTSRTSVDEQEKHSPLCYDAGVRNPQCNVQNGDLWQNGQSSTSFLNGQGNNNNLNCTPCGSSQCDISQNLVTKNNINSYAVHHGIPKEDLSGYRPDLNQTENPHYYQANRLLYQVHLEKAQRQGMSMKNPF